MRDFINIILEAQGELFQDYDKAHRNERLLKWLTSELTWNGNKPKVFYHATTKDFDSFNIVNIGFASVLGMPSKTERHGAFFAVDPKFAQEYIEKENDYENNGRVIPVYLNINNPFDLRDTGLSKILRNDDLVELLADNDIDIKSIAFHWYEHDRWQLFDGADGEDFVNSLKKLGFDGAIMNERSQNADSGEVWVAFSPTQIKSAIGNRGSFEPDTSDIRK